MEYDDDAEMDIEYDDNAAMALQMSVNGGGLVSLSGFNNFSESDTMQAFLPSFDVQPDDFASILRNVGQSIGSTPHSENMDACPTSEGYHEGIQWMGGLDDLSAAPSNVTSDGEVYNQVPYERVSPVLSIPPSVDLSASSTSKPKFASVASEGRAMTLGYSEDRHLVLSVKRRRVGGRLKYDRKKIGLMLQEKLG